MPGPRSNRRIGVVASIVVVALSASAWWLLHSKTKDESIASAAAHAPTTNVLPTPAAAEPNAEPSHLAPSRAVVLIPLADLAASAAPESFTRELSGVHGRLVESDGKPIAGVPVELIELRIEALLASLESGFAELPPDLMKLDVGHATSAQDGTFELHGATAASMHVLGVDLAGARATFRVLDAALERSKSYDLGDVVLQSGTTLTGTVTDEDGAPLADVRVRVLPDLQLPVPIPPMLFDSYDIQDVRTDCSALVVATKDAVKLKLDAPPPLKFLLDRLPLPTTRSGADGKFTLAHVPTGVVTLLADQPKRLGAVKSGVQVPRGREAVDVGTIGLPDGRTVSGRLLAGDTPIAGANVCVGTVLPFPDDEAKIALGHPAGVTDADGKFRLTGLPINGEVVCAAQREAGGAWQLFGPFAQDDVKLECPATATLTVLVQDAESKPVEHAELRLVDRSSPISAMLYLGAQTKVVGRARELEPGRYEIVEQPLGKWSVLARAAESGVGRADDVVVGEQGAVATITLPPPRNLAVKVVDAATHEPVDFALATALVGNLDNGPTNLSIAAARTNHDGNAQLRQLPLDSKLVVRVVHPGYVVATVKLESASKNDVEFALRRGGDFVGRVTCGGEPPNRPLMLILSSHDDAVDGLGDVLPRLAATLPDGTFRVRHLGEGNWHWTLYRRWFDVAPIDLVKTLVGGESPDELKSGEVAIEESKETAVEIATESLDDRATGTVRGVVRVNGELAEGVDVQTEGRHSRSAKTDAAGRFELTEVKSGGVRLQVVDSRSGGSQTIAKRDLDLRAGETKEVELDLQPTAVTVTVRDADGAPIANAHVYAAAALKSADLERAGLDASGTTDAQGRAQLQLSAGKWSVDVNAQGFAHSREEVELAEQDHVRSFELTLTRGVTISGTVVFDGKTPDDTWTFLAIERDGDESDAAYNGSTSTQLQPPERRFELAGLRPGRHRAVVYSNSFVEYEPVLFDVGAAGETNLVLRFKAKG